VVVKFLLTLLEDARPRIIQMAMVPMLGRDSRTNMNLFLGLFMVKLEKQFRELLLKKDLDPEVWITELEDLRVKLIIWTLASLRISL
jgi:hypothetical protein